MSKSGFNIDGLDFVSEWTDEAHILNVQTEDGHVFISTIDSHAIKQHDFIMTRDEWELFKRLVDVKFAEEVAE